MTAIVVLADAADYRARARRAVLPGDTVLEVGCSTGLTTVELAARCRRVFAVDIAHEMVERTRAAVAGRANVVVARLDGRDVLALRELVGAVDALFIDLGGNGPLEAAVATTTRCLAAFKPRLLVVRNEPFADLASLIAAAVPPRATIDRPSQRPYGAVEVLADLIALSTSPSVEHRLIAARRLADDGSDPARIRLAQMAADPNARVRRAAARISTPLPQV